MEKLILDIGCNVGEWIRSNYKPETRFVGIDANPEVCEKAKENLSDLDNVTILNLLVGEKSGYEDFYISELPEVSTASKKWIDTSRHEVEWGSPVKISTITLETLVNVYGMPEFTKIDVEGYEFQVIKGIKSPIGMLSFEFSDEMKKETIEAIKHLYEIGYQEFSWMHGDEYTYRPEEWHDFEEIYNMVAGQLVGSRKEAWGMVFVK